MKYLKKFGKIHENSTPIFKNMDEFSGDYQIILRNEFRDFNKKNEKLVLPNKISNGLKKYIKS